ncbi:unnamed protein product [Lactuca saligna]|uniref:Uncharacterized protein n=1 Tax=Lactuca saligna TaxID=75948 RepID=A0AA35YLD0_LACSI|nr:unnamed protein product [Lactuca saligna]
MSMVKEGCAMSFQVSVLTPTNYPVRGIKVKLIMNAHNICENIESRAFDGRISRNMIDRQSYGCQYKKVMDKQHGVNIMALDFKSGGFGYGRGKIVNPEKVKMVMNVSNGMSSYMLKVL